MCIGAMNQSVSSHCTVGLPSYTPEEVGTLVNLPRWVYTIAREACLFPLPCFVGCGREHGAVHFVSVLRPRQLSWVSPILSSRRWADGNRPCLCTTFALHGSSWQASHRGAEGQSITHFQHVLLTPRFVSMMVCSGFG